MAPAAGLIPLWLKLAYSLFVVVVVPVHWHYYGPQNLLWASNVALLLSLGALWFECALLASMAVVGTLAFFIGWNVAFFSGGALIGGIDYMFDRVTPLWLRSVSLYHVFLPVLLIWLVHRLGYDGRALLGHSVLTWIIVPVTYAVTDPADNVNWVFGPGRAQTALPPAAYLALMMIGLPVAVYLPTHLVLSRLFGRPANGPRARS